ncbi:DUF3772 domain-containing protein [Loktanella sp. Alg231-35]|uniref:DUF3772 domain-containing protein n=1 Tax=Loktanella sp. Alg231-35 TaxID=1922220 RepID=UPI000D556E3A|nr:DUF3772 domain-containing protein [Loktanella sp. Alg231-35]
MIRRLSAFLLVAIVAISLPLAAMAQDASGPVDVIAEQNDWERLATRAEALAGSEDPSLFTIQRLRAELVKWRDQFLADSAVNGGRIGTVNTQIAALGPVPESGIEPEAVAARRAALQAQLTNLTAPRLLAQESYARANGIISEFDGLVLREQTAQLGQRGPSPLNPTHLAAAVAAIWQILGFIGAETTTEIGVRFGSGALLAVLPRALALLVVGIALIGGGRRYITRLRANLAERGGRWLTLRLFLLSLVQIIVPLLGLVLLTASLQEFDIFGLRGDLVVEAIPVAGLFVILGWWLARHLFPSGASNGFLGYDKTVRASGRRYALALAWVMAVVALLEVVLTTMDVTDATLAAIRWPVLVVLGVLLWRLGRAVQTSPEEIEGKTVSAGQMRNLVGRLCTLVAVAGPLLAGLGYTVAGQELMLAFILSLTLVGVILLLQRIVHDLNTAEDAEKAQGLRALLPVFASFVIYLLSLPVFALIWGARVDDLREVWTQFREGFTIGDTQISPTDFLTFALVFALGYLLTRFIQSTLRKSVLPRTRLDLGGQNAIVAGFGYVGVILAAIVAITSAGIDLSSLAIVAGALSVGIGFGLQNIVSNFVSGIILLIERPVSEGDWIEVGGQMGYVRSISVRSTRIETFDRTDVIIPNADLVSGQVTNWTRGNLVGRVIVPVGVAYGSDVDKVTEILRGIAEAHPLVIMTPPPSVLFRGFGADSLDFEIRAILRDVNYVLVAQSEMNVEIARQFAEAGIEIPFAQRDIWLRNPEVLKERPE